LLKKIAHTVFIRLLSAIVNIGIVVLTSRYLGAEGKGWYSWWILNITFTMLLSNFIGGSAIVYFASRYKSSSILIPSYVWGMVSGLLVAIFLMSIEKLDSIYFTHFAILSIIETFISIHLFIFQGKNKIAWLNWFQFLNLFLFAGYFGVSSWLFGTGISVVLDAFYFSKVIVLLVTIVYLGRIIRTDTTIKSLKISELFRFGLVLQIANIAQFLNYRFSFYLLEDIDPSLFFLGVFSTAISVAEGIWILSKSISAVHYAEVSNSRDPEKSVNTTLKLLRLTSIIVLFGILVLLVIPSLFYTWLLGNDFKSVKNLIILLSPGIFIFSISGIVSHFFSGIGQNKFAMTASIVGLVCTITLGYCLIPIFQMQGAAIVTSISYLVSTLFLVTTFKYKYRIPLRKFIASKSDFTSFYTQIHKLIFK